LDAVDYLVKPVNQESISAALDKLRKRLNISGKADNPEETIMIKNKHELYFLKKNSIFFLEKELRKTVIHTQHGRYTTNEPLRSLCSKFNTDFFRCHKSYSVNLRKIEKVYPIDERVYGIAFLDYSKEALMGRKAFKEFCSQITRKRC
jgi:DNA-binding LytR/AlgR family response regulator